MSHPKALFLILALVVWTERALAKTDCDITPFEKNRGLLHEIVRVTRPSEHQRRTEDQYASDKKLDPALVRQLFRGVRPYDITQDDCGSASGTSGVGQFIREASTGKTVLGAIRVAGTAKVKEGSGYNSETLFNASVQLRGGFLQAVRAAIQ